VVVTDPGPRAAIAALYRRAAAGARSGTRPGDPYLAKLQITDAAAPRFAQQQRMFASGAHLVQHLREVPVLALAYIEGFQSVRHGLKFGEDHFLWIKLG
jgi:hypothetical protein